VVVANKIQADDPGKAQREQVKRDLLENLKGTPEL